ncbi:MAG TPA: hypothetical protein VH208_07555 [Myxococcaceae bacterium]|nr:hypothetical protein [Myxococcaceae bacterium]
MIELDARWAALMAEGECGRGECDCARCQADDDEDNAWFRYHEGRRGVLGPRWCRCWLG